MASKAFLLVLLLAVTLVITSKVAARDLAEPAHPKKSDDASKEVSSIEDAKYGGYNGGYPGRGGYPGGGHYPGRGGYPGGGRYPGPGGGRGGYCRYGCCGRRDFHGNCLRCCPYQHDHPDVDSIAAQDNSHN